MLVFTFNPRVTPIYLAFVRSDIMGAFGSCSNLTFLVSGGAHGNKVWARLLAHPSCYLHPVVICLHPVPPLLVSPAALVTTSCHLIFLKPKI